jgi:hypothetical protein
MTSLFMGVLTNNPVPVDEADVRNTATPVNNEKPAAVNEDMPMQGEFTNDPDPKLGLGPRQLASAWTQGQPVDTGARMDPVAQTTISSQLIDQQVSTSGFAASREAAGQAHTSLSYAVGIEPVGDLQENHKFGETYFMRHPRDIQDGMGAFMQAPPGMDTAAILQDASTGKVVSRDATTASIYDLFLGGPQ